MYIFLKMAVFTHQKLAAFALRADVSLYQHETLQNGANGQDAVRKYNWVQPVRKAIIGSKFTHHGTTYLLYYCHVQGRMRAVIIGGAELAV